MLRQYDWECGGCGTHDTHLVDVPHGTPVPKVTVLACRACGEALEHERLISAPAVYLGERQHNPMISGGRFDTTGYAALPSYPDASFEIEHQKRIAKKLATLPKDCSNSDFRQAAREVAHDAPSHHDYHEHMTSPECREITRERRQIDGQNKQKRKRLAAMKRGQNVNFRRDRCAGDPNLSR